MKKILFAVLAICLLANLAMAGDDNTPKTKDGDKAWLFTLGGLSNLSAGNFNGGVGGKCYISDGNAIRLSLGFSTTNVTTKYTGPVDPTRADNKVSGTGFSIVPAYLHSLTSNGPVNAYIGFQAGIGWTSATNENPGFVNNNKNKTSTTTIVAAGVAGVEWFAWSNVSFGAEYQLGYGTTSGTNEVTVGGTTTSTDTPSVNSFSLTSVSGGNLTLSVYW